VTETWTYTCAHALTQADIDASGGSFSNTATVTSKLPGGGGGPTDTDSRTVPLSLNPAINLVKNENHSGFHSPVQAGDSIQYSFTVQNTGNLTLNTIVLTDAKCNSGPTYQSGDANSNSKLEVTETWAYTCAHAVTQADIDGSGGSFTNTATVTSKLPGGGDGPTSTKSKTISLTQAPVLTLVKTGTLDQTVVLPDNVADPGDTISYTFTITNTGNVTLTNIRLTDKVGGVTITGKNSMGDPVTSIASLAPGQSDSTTFTGIYVLKQVDVDSGSFTNTAEVLGTPPTGTDTTAQEDDLQLLGYVRKIGIAKRVVGDPVKISAGTWDVTFEIMVRNYGNVTLTNVQVVDNLATAFPQPSYPDPKTFQVQSLTSSDFTVNSAYDGELDKNLLVGTDSLAFKEEGRITLVVRVVPTKNIYENSATASGTPGGDPPISDVSQNGEDPDPDGNINPTDNNDPTPVNFGASIFDPPFGVKLVKAGGVPVLRWTMVWINDTNIVAVNALVSDGIPKGSMFVDDGVPNGYALPADAPAGSVASGVTCLDASVITETLYCYYEGPTAAYPRGRIVWQGVLGPDYGNRDSKTAVNDIQIAFNIRVISGVNELKNVATIGVDSDGDGVITANSTQSVATASRSWVRPSMPGTGFAPGRITVLPPIDGEFPYRKLGNIRLEIPALNLNREILLVPLNADGWDLSWLGDNVGYLEGTAFPSFNGNSALTGHVFDANGNPGPFEKLYTLKWGDEAIVEMYGSRYIYQVRENITTDPKDTLLFKHETIPWLSLVTCKNFDETTNTYLMRVVVRAVLVRIEPVP